jgi:hypothetical protein
MLSSIGRCTSHPASYDALVLLEFLLKVLEFLLKRTHAVRQASGNGGKTEGSPKKGKVVPGWVKYF